MIERTKINLIFNIGIRISSVGILFLFNIVISRSLGIEDTGIFFLSISVITILSVISRYGFDNAIVRYTAIHYSTNNKNYISSLVKHTLLTSGVISLSITLIAIFFSRTLSTYIFNKPELEQCLQLMSLSILPMSSLFLISEFIRGINKISLYQIFRSALMPILAIAGLVALKATTLHTTVLIIIIAYLVTMLGAFIVLCHFIRQIPTKKHKLEKFSKMEFSKTCRPMFSMSIINVITSWSPTIFLGIWASSNQIAIYNVSLKTASVLSLIVVAVNSITAPKFALLYKKNKLKEIESTARKYISLSLLLALPIAIPLFLAPSSILHLYGDQFDTGWLLLVILSVGHLVNVLTGPVGNILLMTGNETVMRNLFIISGILNITIGAFFTYTYGVYGAATISTLNLILFNTSAIFIVKKKLGISILPRIATLKKWPKP